MIVNRGLSHERRAEENVRTYDCITRTFITCMPRRMIWAGHVARMGEMRNAYILIERPEGKRPIVRPRRRWENNIRMDL